MVGEAGGLDFPIPLHRPKYDNDDGDVERLSMLITLSYCPPRVGTSECSLQTGPRLAAWCQRGYGPTLSRHHPSRLGVLPGLRPVFHVLHQPRPCPQSCWLRKDEVDVVEVRAVVDSDNVLLPHICQSQHLPTDHSSTPSIRSNSAPSFNLGTSPTGRPSFMNLRDTSLCANQQHVHHGDHFARLTVSRSTVAHT